MHVVGIFEVFAVARCGHAILLSSVVDVAQTCMTIFVHSLSRCTGNGALL